MTQKALARYLESRVPEPVATDTLIAWIREELDAHGLSKHMKHSTCRVGYVLSLLRDEPNRIQSPFKP